jgi:hypothetical protein
MTFSIHCPCCSQQVEARDAGFSATTVEVVACAAQKAAGVVSWTMRKSAAYAAAAPAETFRHKDGFVTFG